MARTVAITCSACRRKIGGDETFNRHRYIAGDRWKCYSDADLIERGILKDRWGVWRRGIVPGQGTLSLSVTPERDGNGSGLGTPTDNRQGKAHSLARDTERKAAREITPRTGTARARVLFAIDSTPQTDDELQRSLAMNPNTQRPRRVELVEGGYIEDSGERRKTPSRSDAIVWQVTPTGRLWCLQERAASA